ncbi:hypothetical protein HK107_06900 [Parvularcula sp. ZS-1/3]|uniref:PEP-CTERM sorting domain-containing protein n=1 Tax=Parvularcula mediterranea TaxID=2732508 RepID=A0A7Y3RML9_9PROT|nr:hypothetical protein [Parvularcula mediterranea]NNU16047.1 hypothetical protein [Parvularcula mediterranea]
MPIRFLAAAAAALLGLSSAHAAMIDLTPFPANSQQSDGPAGFDIGPARLDSFFSNAPGFLPNAILFLDSNFTFQRMFCFQGQFAPCGASGAMYFDAPVFNISFQAEQTSTRSPFSVQAFDTGNQLLAARSWDDAMETSSRTRLFDFAGVGPIATLVFGGNDFRAFGDFQFDRVSNEIPLPAAPLLFLTGLGVVAFRKRG